jgi:hypothetical protein
MRRIFGIFGGIRALPRRLLQLVIDTDNLILLLAGIGLSLALVIFVLPVAVPFAMENAPITMPFVKPGVACNHLGAPLGGNNRSMLTLEGEPFQEIELDILLVDTSITQGGELKTQVILENQDIGPVIIFMPETSDLVANSGAPLGVRIDIFDINGGASPVLSFGIPDAARPRDVTFQDYEIHLLQSHDSCHQIYDLDLASLPVGEYSIVARYNNTTPGTRPPIAGQTPDPNFPTQGVWTTNAPIVSPQRRFSIQPPPTPTLPVVAP